MSTAPKLDEFGQATFTVDPLNTWWKSLMVKKLSLGDIRRAILDMLKTLEGQAFVLIAAAVLGNAQLLQLQPIDFKFILENIYVQLGNVLFNLSPESKIDAFSSPKEKSEQRKWWDDTAATLAPEHRSPKNWVPQVPPKDGQLTPEKFFESMLAKILTLVGQAYVRAALTILNFVKPLVKVLSKDDVEALNDRLVGIIYKLMPHPPEIISGYDYRSADGSDNLGRAGRPYAKNVRTKLRIPSNPEIPAFQENGDIKIFEKLLKRPPKPLQPQAPQDKDKPSQPPQDKVPPFCPSVLELSALTFAYGTLVIHSVFNSDLTDHKINTASSYFDLSPLYGSSQEAQDKIRNKNGRGYVLADCFSDTRMLSLPPAAGVILVLFNRNHNYIAQQLFDNCATERKWLDPDSKEIEGNPSLREQQDEDIFQTARLINCMHFVNVVITDYVGGLMGKTQQLGGWPYTAKVFGEINLPDMVIGRGDGNLVSVEFNTLYRWHSSLSEMEVKWAEDLLYDLVGKRENLLPKDFVKLQAAARVPALDHPSKRTFGDLQRNEDGVYDDRELAKFIKDASEAPAGQFRARGSPNVLSFVDIQGIRAARAAGVCTLNEFRRDFLKLRPFESFEDWNADPKIAAAASQLYGGDINKLELYPGLHAEGQLGDGFRQDNNYDRFNRVHTMRNGLLFDAISLIRGDRFFTTAWTERNATPWGFNDVKRDFDNAAFGGHIHKILTRTLPGQYPDKNVYTWFPMTLPSTMKRLLKDNKNYSGWDFGRPVPTPEQFYDDFRLVERAGSAVAGTKATHSAEK